jgi:hypothetical protein
MLLYLRDIEHSKTFEFLKMYRNNIRLFRILDNLLLSKLLYLRDIEHSKTFWFLKMYQNEFFYFKYSTMKYYKI